MFTRIDENGAAKYGVVSLAVDTPAEMATLPTDFAAGSTVIVISTSSVYMLNSGKEWVEI